LQLIVEAGTYPIDSPQSQHLLQLSRRLLDAFPDMEGVDAATLTSSVAPDRNPWDNWAEPGIENITFLSDKQRQELP
jgi:hypothetical protein